MDDTIYQKGDVVVTKTLAKVSGITYPINGIGSVLIAKPNRGFLLFLVWACVIAAIMSVGHAVQDGNWGVFVATALGAGLFWFAASRRPYALRLRTASGDQNVIELRDLNRLNEIKDAIEKAVTLRG